MDYILESVLIGGRCRHVRNKCFVCDSGANSPLGNQSRRARLGTVHLNLYSLFKWQVQNPQRTDQHRFRRKQLALTANVHRVRTWNKFFIINGYFIFFAGYSTKSRFVVVACFFVYREYGYLRENIMHAHLLWLASRNRWPPKAPTHRIDCFSAFPSVPHAPPEHINAAAYSPD